MSNECFEGFVYLDLDNPMVAWNVVRGWYCTPDQLPEAESCSLLSFNMANLLASSLPNRLLSEIAIERIRRENYRNQVSRLTGIFVFDDPDSVARTWIDNTWGAHFKDDYLTDVGVNAHNSSRLDANWLTKIMDRECSLTADFEEHTNSYWQGVPCPDSDPIWERIVNGSATIWGTEIKVKALEEIKRYWPKSLKTLEYSANAAGFGSFDGLVLPLTTQKGKFINIDYHIRMHDAKNCNFLNNMISFYRKSPQKACHLSSNSEFFLPDFSMYSFYRESTLD
ncbi:hypothetical protein F9K88_10450 [Brucella intermedia]|uniref:Uncharacterized protein n=1 Tax=Brucella intermedia LMG 3301 TaxID=641118 RepID=C4WIV1_9HYPH|nr:MULTISPECIES: hypothetical protein [Brucella]EEQ95142.1 Hypothetical protein OINT_1000490 [Brucella intermedia LMG 3301]KAB2711778.1 hypothetical protein F9K88_10450 [Brucella intermedia]MCH6203177.1 hypothetical protein [Brucella ciceri]MDL2202943.1 hypothetical protein [Brucella intermedia]NVM40491.1 hypothetical protein [Brucella intermedia]